MAQIKRKKIVNGCIVFLAVLSLQQFACAENTRDYIGKGNGLYNAGQYSGAIAQYDQAILESPTSFEPKFNKANSYFRLDDLAAAIDLYREVASSSKDMQLVERAKYNRARREQQELQMAQARGEVFEIALAESLFARMGRRSRPSSTRRRRSSNACRRR